MKRGFTIVELMIVLAIILLLAAIIVPSYQQWRHPERRPYNPIPGFVVIVDTVTGCQYLQRQHRPEATLTPRFGPNGKQICSPPAVETSK